MRVAGPPDIVLTEAGRGPAVVFLHGIGGNRRNFDAQVAHFGSRRHALAWDARGYGDSADYDGALDFGDFSDDLVRVLDAIGAERAALVGVSMGGRIALDFAGRYPDRLGALVLADCSAGSAAAQDPAKIAAFLAARRKPLIEDGLTPADTAPAIARSFAGPSITPAQYDALVASLSALRTDSYLKTLDCVTRYHGFPAFADVAAPTLVLTGTHDPIAPPAMAKAMAEAIAGARYVELASCGHISNIEQPEAFNAAVEAFLDAVWPGLEAAA
jgi:3-oxoadipate enol-lactonase